MKAIMLTFCNVYTLQTTPNSKSSRPEAASYLVGKVLDRSNTRK